MIEKLIERGIQISEKNVSETDIGPAIVNGVDYVEWIYDCRRFLEDNFPNSFFTNEFKEHGRNAIGNPVSHLYSMLGILKSVKNGIEDGTLTPDSDDMSYI